MMNALSNAGLKVSASLDVVGWNQDQCLLNESMGEDIVRYVEAALAAGLGASEIEADLIGRWTGFSSISVEISSSFRRASALVFAVAVPLSATSERPLASSFAA